MTCCEFCLIKLAGPFLCAQACCHCQLSPSSCWSANHVVLWLLAPGPEKDSNTQITLLGRIIDHAERILAARGMPLPMHLTVLTDNTCREMKKPKCYKTIGGYLVTKAKFHSVSFHMFRVGHTHNELDQRFGTIATCLARARPDRPCW